MSIATSQPISPAAVHFTLRSPTIEMGRTIAALRDAASDLRFTQVGPVVNLIGEDCAIENNDPLAGLKAHARGFLVAPGGALSILPYEIDAFSFELPNGLIGHIGLCRYPEQFEINGKVLKTKIFGAQWMSFIRTIRLDQDCPGDCVKSHTQVLRLLRQAESLGILTAINDPYKQWKTPNMGTFEQICQEQKELVCSH
jgi:hypothetical protein